MKHHISRRKFIGQASCASLGCTTFLSTLFNLKSLNAASISNSLVAGGNDYKALVCILLEGGNDSFNMLIPTNQTAYEEYSVSRSNLAIPRNDLLQLNNTELGLHPSLESLQRLYNNNKLSFISNIGTLIEHVDKTQVFNSYPNLPLGLYSHSDQTRQWQTSLPHERSALGWGGKIADMINDVNDNDNISMNISLNGRNVFQTGRNTIDYSIDPYEGSVGIIGDQPDWLLNELRGNAIDNMLDAEYQNLFKKAYVDVVKVSREANVQFQDAIGPFTQFETSFSDNEISESMKMIAKVISARETLGMKRQIFFVNFGGWDHHDEVLMAQTEMLEMLGNAIEELNTVLTEINMADCVTTFSMSEFGRTLTSNGNGTDHAWGGNVMVMGDHVNGGNVFGNYPSLALEGDLEVGGGVLIPTTSVDEYFAELALWFGVEPSSLSELFPNIGNFYNTNSGTMPIGFLNQ